MNETTEKVVKLMVKAGHVASPVEFVLRYGNREFDLHLCSAWTTKNDDGNGHKVRFYYMDWCGVRVTCKATYVRRKWKPSEFKLTTKYTARQLGLQRATDWDAQYEE